MSEKLTHLQNKTLLPDLPRDVPMPRYKYQEDRNSEVTHGAQADAQKRADQLLAGTNYFGCAAISRS